MNRNPTGSVTIPVGKLPSGISEVRPLFLLLSLLFLVVEVRTVPTLLGGDVSCHDVSPLLFLRSSGAKSQREVTGGGALDPWYEGRDLTRGSGRSVPFTFL